MKLTLQGQLDILAELTQWPLYDEIKGIPFKIEGIEDVDAPVVSIVCSGDEVTDEEMRSLKRVFGPLIYTDDYGTTNARGIVKILYMPDGCMTPVTVKLRIRGALTCTPDVAAASGATGEQVEKLIKQFEAGEIKLQTCTSMKHVELHDLCTTRMCRGTKMREGLCYECWNDAQRELMKVDVLDPSTQLRS